MYRLSAKYKDIRMTDHPLKVNSEIYICIVCYFLRSISRKFSIFFFCKKPWISSKCSLTRLFPNSYTFFTNPLKKSRSCDTTIRVLSKSIKAFFKMSLVFRSKWLVGSSKINRFTGDRRSLIMAKTGSFSS